jgi:hypothetical protein
MIKRNSISAKEYLGKTVLFNVPFPVHEKVDGHYVVTGYEDKPARYQAVKFCKSSAYTSPQKKRKENDKHLPYTWIKSKRPVDFDATVDVVQEIEVN